MVPAPSTATRRNGVISWEFTAKRGTAASGKVSQLIGGNFYDFAVFPEDHGYAVLAMLADGFEEGKAEGLIDRRAVSKDQIQLLLWLLFYFHRLQILSHSSGFEIVMT